MLSTRPAIAAPTFTRRDLSRFAIGAAVLIGTLTAIFALDLLPHKLDIKVGDVASADIVAPRAYSYVSQVLTQDAKDKAAAAVEPAYDYSEAKAAEIATAQVAAFQDAVKPIDNAFAVGVKEDARKAILENALVLTPAARQTLLELTPDRWKAVRAEASRVLEATEAKEIRDTRVDDARSGLASQMVLQQDERALAAEIITPLVVANSAYSPELTSQARTDAANAVTDVMVDYALNESIVRRGERVTPAEIEAITVFGLTEARPDFARLVGWFLLATIVVGVLLAWIWRFRIQLWHRTNAMVLIGLIVVGTALILKLTAGRPGLAFIVPTAATGILLAILLDAGVAAIATGLIGVMAAALNTGPKAPDPTELMAFIFFGGMAGIIAIRKGDRFQVFVRAGLAVAIVNVLVVAMFGFLGIQDAQGVIELMGASILSGAGSAVAAVGTFAVLGSVFGILTVFQLLELANPSQPLLRRLLVETPGTYHHSLMVGNLAERAAEAIGADPLLVRVAAYYHDVGKLANPLAYIENQSGGENIHDELPPEESAALVKAHVANGIDLAYQYKLPKPIVAFIPQHHGTALMSYFYARAQEQAPTTEIDPNRYRHGGPKPQTRDAAILMLADGVE